MEPKPIKHIALWEIKRKNDHKATMEYSSGFNIVARKIKEKVKKQREKTVRVSWFSPWSFVCYVIRHVCPWHWITVP